jgi:prophage maintenance system killer protein
VALVTTGVFLELNGIRLTAPEPDTVLAILALVKGEMKVVDYAEWLRVSSKKS